MFMHNDKSICTMPKTFEESRKNIVLVYVSAQCTKPCTIVRLHIPLYDIPYIYERAMLCKMLVINLNEFYLKIVVNLFAYIISSYYICPIKLNYSLNTCDT